MIHDLFKKLENFRLTTEIFQSEHRERLHYQLICFKFSSKLLLVKNLLSSISLQNAFVKK